MFASNAFHARRARSVVASTIIASLARQRAALPPFVDFQPQSAQQRLRAFVVNAVRWKCQ
eukprot:3937633-Pyramimonas_sp.AAC.1